MGFLLLAVVCSAVVIHCFRFAQTRGYPVGSLLIVNYLMASVVGWAQALGRPMPATPEPGLGLLVLGVGTGALFLGNFLLLNHAVGRLGPSVAGAASRMSAVVPVLLSIVIFREAPGLAGWLGIGLALAALPWAVPGNGAAGTRLRDLAPALWVFLGFGINDFTLKVQNNGFPPASKPWFLAIVYTTALVLSLVWAVRTQRGSGRVRPGAWAVGLVLGTANYFSTFFLSLALGQMDGSRAYALNSLGVIAVVTLSSLVLWRERPAPKTFVFLGLAMVAVVLIQV